MDISTIRKQKFSLRWKTIPTLLSNACVGLEVIGGVTSPACFGTGIFGGQHNPSVVRSRAEKWADSRLLTFDTDASLGAHMQSIRRLFCSGHLYGIVRSCTFSSVPLKNGTVKNKALVSLYFLAGCSSANSSNFSAITSDTLSTSSCYQYRSFSAICMA